MSSRSAPSNDSLIRLEKLFVIRHFLILARGEAYYGSIQSLAEQGVVALQACAFVEPAGSCLVTASPFEPVDSVAGWFQLGELGGEQLLDLADGERDEAGIGGRSVARPGRRGGLGVGAVPQPGGGDGTDREGGHDQDEVAQDRGVE